MSYRSILLTVAICASIGSPSTAQPAAAPVGESTPIPCLETGGPAAAVTSLAFSPDGTTLYAAGYDKVVHVWRMDPNTKAYGLDQRATFRIPIGPGRDGVINVIAVSPDGSTLAVSGLGVYRGGSGFTQSGWIVPEATLTPEMRQDRALIYLFSTKTRALSLLRGHEEDVLALAFAPQRAGQPQLLVSVGRKPSDESGPSPGRICVWDVSKAASLTDKGELTDHGPRLYDWKVANLGAVPGEPPPALAVRLTPEGNYRVATAWGDGKLRLKEFGPGGVVATPESVDEPLNSDGKPAQYTQALAAVGSQFVTGGYVKGKGYIQEWQDASGQSPKPTKNLALKAPSGAVAVLPRAIDLISSGNGRGLDHAAIVLRTPSARGAGQDYRLALLDLNSLRIVDRSDADSFLGTWTRAPALATSADGRMLAVTGDQSRTIRVVAASDLFAKTPKSQVLHGTASGATAIAFARKGQPPELGVVLRNSAGPISAIQADDVVLDASKRGLSANAVGQGWKLTSPSDLGWSVSLRPTGNATSEFQWAGPRSRGRAELRLKPTQIATAYALVPPRAPLTEPLLAVATWDAKISEPALLLLNATSAKPIRQLIGHSQTITSLAATADGRLLASTAEDQTACVWTLTDLPDIVGKHGALTGVVLKQRDKDLVVIQVDAGSSADGVLAVDDVVQSISFHGTDRKERNVTSQLDLLLAVRNEKPGDTVQLRLRRAGEEKTVSLKLDQGVDERKPLATLFVTRNAAPEWIAWTPLGPYDTGGRATERFLGWHFNPAKLGEPVRFAGADAYRERMYKPGLLKSLLASANVTDAIRALERAAALPRATIFCSVEGAGPVQFGDGATDQVLVHEPRAKLQLRVQGPSVERREIDSLTWRLDGGAVYPISLDNVTGDSLAQTIDLGARGIHRVQINLRTRETEAQSVTRDIAFRYQPPAPRVRIENLKEGQSTVREARLQFKGEVSPGVAGQKVKVNLRNGLSETTLSDLKFDQTITLVPGENVLELKATNDGALPGYEDSETTSRTFVVVFQPKEAPTISLSAVAAAGQADVRIEPGRPTVVETKKVRIQGRVTAAEPLTAASVGEASVRGFRPNSIRDLAIDEEVTLKPGEQDFVFKAKSANSDEAVARLKIAFRPQLPILTLTDPDPDLTLVEGKDAREIQVRGRLTPPEGITTSDWQQFEVVFRVSNLGKPVLQEGDNLSITLPSDRLTPEHGFTKKLVIQPGDNRIDVIVRNPWRQNVAAQRHVTYKRPPRIAAAISASPPAERPFTTVSADVVSVTDLTRIECNGREYPVHDVARRVGDSDWKLTLAEIPLIVGPNPIQLVVSNRDGSCLQPGKVNVEYVQPKPKAPPQVDLINRPRGAVKNPQFTARFVVRSNGSRIRAIELRQESRVLMAAKSPNQENDGAGVYVAQGELGPMTLTEGANNLRLVAINDGGESETGFTISYMPIPEWIEIDRPVSPQPKASFALTGRVNWAEAVKAADVERKLKGLKVYVNSAYQEQEPTYRRVGENSMEFSVNVALNRAKDNVIEVQCPELRPEAGGRQRFTLDCTQPENEPRTLHLLVVAIRHTERDPTDKQLALRALSALQARGAGDRGLKSNVFQHVVMHPYVKDKPTQVLSGYVTCEHVRDALESIRRLAKPNDVAMIYWLGTEEVNEVGDLYLHTSESRPGRKLAHTSIALKEILNFPREVPGACALLLDTAASGSPPVENPPTVQLPSTRVAVMRYAWSTAGDTVPGLMLALEESSRQREATSFKDLASYAGQSLQKVRQVATWDDNLKEVPALADTVIIRRQ